MALYVCELNEEDVVAAEEQASAHAQGSDEINENKKKGNLGEIAFQKFCEKELSRNYNWMHDSQMEKGEAEHDQHDFRLGKATVDVKTRQDITDFRPDEMPDSGSTSDVYVFVLLNFNCKHATILGWATHHELLGEGTGLSNPFPTVVDPIILRNIEELEPWVSW